MFSLKSSIFILIVSIIGIIGFNTTVSGNHSWGSYHWARTANPFTLKLGDNITTAWDNYLVTTSNDWSLSSALDTAIVSGSVNAKTCKATLGRANVCNSKYGSNGWLGVASIWATGSHITQGTVKLNDTYFSTAKYNTSAWRNLVMCQEVGHIFGLDHQDENFSNPPLGTCMDYSNDPIPNQHPNQHDYDQLATIYTHLDSTTTTSQTVSGLPNNNASDSAEWGTALRKDSKGRTSLYVRDLGNNEKVFTFVLWAD